MVTAIRITTLPLRRCLSSSHSCLPLHTSSRPAFKPFPFAVASKFSHAFCVVVPRTPHVHVALLFGLLGYLTERLCFTGTIQDRDMLFVGCLTSQQHASIPQGRICSDNFTCCHTEIEVADQTFRLTQSQYTDTGPISLSTDPITPGAWQGSHWSANFEVTGMTRPGKIPVQAGFEPRIFRSQCGPLGHRGGTGTINPV